VVTTGSSPGVPHPGHVAVDLPDPRTQLETRSSPRFGVLRSEVYEFVQRAKRGERLWGPAEGDGTS